MNPSYMVEAPGNELYDCGYNPHMYYTVQFYHLLTCKTLSFDSIKVELILFLTFWNCCICTFHSIP